MTKRPCSARRRGRQRGSIIGMTELALILLPFFAIFFAIIDFSIAVFLKSNFQQAVREGVRYAITYQTITGQCQDASIKQVVQNNAVGFLSGTGANTIKIRYYNPAVSLTTEATGLNSNNPGNVVEVGVENFNPSLFLWIAPLSGSIKNGQEYRNRSWTVSAYASDVMGGLPVGNMNPPCR
jgi:Flp pilus assembly protein TadG